MEILSIRFDGSRPTPSTRTRGTPTEYTSLSFAYWNDPCSPPAGCSPDRLIIDGFHRWRLSQDSMPVRTRWKGRVPVAVLDVDRPSAMLMTIRINRAKGTHVAIEMSSIVRELIEEHGMDRGLIAKEIGGTRDEVDLLAQDGVFAARKISHWGYSPAWYPKAETQ